MITIIAVVCILIAVIGAAVQSNKIRSGWVPAKFAGRADAFLTAKRKEYTMLSWLGVIAGPFWFVIALVEWGTPAAYERLVLGVIFIACGLVMFGLRAKLPTQPVPTP